MTTGGEEILAKAEMPEGAVSPATGSKLPQPWSPEVTSAPNLLQEDQLILLASDVRSFSWFELTKTLKARFGTERTMRQCKDR